MTTETATTAGQEAVVDTGPLSWLMNEIRDALARSAHALEELVSEGLIGRAAGTKQLQVTKTYLHQAHGALQMVDIAGATSLTEAAQQLIDKVETGRHVLNADHVQVIRIAYQALCEHLEELLAGRPNRPVRLFPYYQDLMEIQGIDRAHPADLYFPVISQPRAALLPSQQELGGDEEPAQRYARLRQRFEPGLLAFMKASDLDAERSGAEKLVPILADVYDMQADASGRAFWWTLLSLLQGVASGDIVGDRFVKQLFGRINIQLRQMGHGDFRHADRLQRDALFMLASAPDASPGIQTVLGAFGLGTLAFDDFGQRHYGKVDIDLLRLARDRMHQVKGSWEHISSSDYAPFENFVAELDALAAAVGKLQPDQLQRLTDVLCHIVRQLVAANARDKLTSSDLGLEIARALLFIESTLQNIYHLPDGYLEQVNINCARLQALADGEAVMHPADRDIYQGARDKQLMRTLVHELVATLRQVEKQLDDYFVDPSQRASLPVIDKSLHQIEGVLAIQDRHEAIEVVQLVRRELRQLGDLPEGQQPDDSLFSKIARNVGGLSFYIETLASNDGQTASFTFDAATGVYQVNILQPAFMEAAQPEDDAIAADEPEQPGSAELAASPLQAVPATDGGGEPPTEHADPVATEALFWPAVDMNSAAPPDESVLPAIPVAEKSIPQTIVNIADIDPELLDIFLGEAEEVLDDLQHLIPNASATPNDQESMAVLRRGFHTLKGSSRMVGLNQFGEASWQIERVMNAWVAEGRTGTPELYSLLSASTQYLRSWVDALRAGTVAERSLDTITTLAEALLAGQPLNVALLYMLRHEQPTSGAQENLPPLDLHYELPDLSFLDEPVSSGEQAEDATDAQDTEDQDGSESSSSSFSSSSSYVSFDAIELAPVVVSYDGFNIPEPSGTDMLPELLPAEPVADDNAVPLFSAEPARQNFSEVPELSDEVEAIPEAAESDTAEPAAGVTEHEASPADAFFEPVELLEPAEQDALAELNASHAPETAAAAVAESGAAEADQAIVPALHGDSADNGTVKVGPLVLSQPLYNIYMAETEQLVNLLTQDFEEWRLEPKREVSIASITAAHSLAGSSATVGFMALQELAHALEMVLQCKTEYPAAMRDADHEKLLRVVARSRRMLERFAHGEIADHEPMLVASLADLRRALEGRKAFSGGEARDFGPVSLIPLSEIDTDFEHGNDAQPDSVPLVSEQKAQADDQAADSREHGSRQHDSTADLTDTSHIQMRSTDRPAAVAPVAVTAVDGSLMVGNFVPPVNEAARVASLPPALPGLSALSRLANAEGVILDGIVLQDDLDDDLLPVFIEEGQTILPDIAAAIRGWQLYPDDGQTVQSLLRHLHTIKGSARMAGAMRFGQHMHDMESLVVLVLRNSPPTVEILDNLLAHFDVGMQMFDALQNPLAVHSPASAADAVTAAAGWPQPGSNVPEKAVSALPSAPLAPLPAQAAEPRSAAHIRVNAEVLDRLSNQTGEVAIVRTRLDAGIENMRTSLTELSENIERLRGQLRELDIQAESQISARMTQPGEREFDPLEFDRFTRLQELTRIIAETISDVGTVQKNLVASVSAADTDLIAQSRLTRDLQQELMRVRMVPFGSVSERLYRLTRQVSKETGKRVNLDIVGVNTDIDRGVLEKITAPLEHLLRNSMVHGIESLFDRRSQGKPDAGQLKLEIRQEGNEIFIRLSDDGRGLDLGAIEAKARSQNLIAQDALLAPEEVADLIFLPGFSTADNVTELAGRGVGMDVVRAEASLLGGRVTTATQQGKGAQFTIRLPLTLAVLQVVLLKAGERTHSIPSGMIMQVLQVPASQMEAIYATREIEWQHRVIPAMHLSTLLGSDAPIAVRAQTQVLILKSDTDFVAIAVDDVLGNREVVIKNMGPQLSRMTGISGATVMGNGDIILILNPVPLALRAMKGQAGSITVNAAAQAAPEQAGGHAVTTAPAPVRRQIRVMVVDDSLTVRRVTQRLLEREGFGVMLAKDGLDALQQLQGDRPDVMLIDIEMPRMDGFDLTRNVRNAERTKHIPIIVITSRNAEKHRTVAVELGANEYLGKPYQEDQLLQAIETVLNKSVAG